MKCIKIDQFILRGSFNVEESFQVNILYWSGGYIEEKSFKFFSFFLGVVRFIIVFAK